jgi:signal transduction histidine kinase
MRNDNTSALDHVPPVTHGYRRTVWWLLCGLYAVCVVAFILDLQRADTLAFGIIYAPVIATALLHKRRVGLWIMTTLACLAVVLGAFFPMIGSDLPDMIGNRILSIIAIVATAAFVHHARNIQDRLTTLTRRAEAAERIKTEVLTDLSREIRTPLHTLLGVLTLTMINSKPEQREVLGRVRNDGKQLLATIDNLIDLTQIEARKLRRQTIDIALIARDAAESAGPSARDNQVTVALADVGEAAETRAIGDSWAIRRILDNFVANAVRVTPPGGTVSLSVNRLADTVTASVSDNGKGLPPELTQFFHEDASTTEGSVVSSTGGAGLALSSRLARTMNGKVIAHNHPGTGAMVSLSLPAA